jgi:hypothetical protein
MCTSFWGSSEFEVEILYSLPERPFTLFGQSVIPSTGLLMFALMFIFRAMSAKTVALKSEFSAIFLRISGLMAT